MNDKLRQLLAERYPIVRSTFPGEGRRKWCLRIIEDLWLAPEARAEIASAALNSQSPPGEHVDYDNNNDDDPLDELAEGEEAGLLIRTDFSDDAAWDRFVCKMRDAEKDVFAAMTSGEGDDVRSEDDAEMNGDTSSESEATPSHVIKIVQGPDSSLLNGISNLTALRLFNDVDMRAAPTPPTGTSRIHPGNRLVDQHGLQEIYKGKTVWIYDRQSNVDESVRLVSQQGDVYGTATGDSWRARASHVAELQLNITYYGMEINFGGLDRWDYSERMRNLNEAEKRLPLTMVHK